MSNIADLVIDSATSLLEIQKQNSILTRDSIEKMVHEVCNMMKVSLTDEEVLLIIKKIEASILITMTLGGKLKDSTYKPWLLDVSKDIEFYYWSRYKKHLRKQGLSYNVIGKMDLVTNDILDLMQNPKDDGKWKRRGLVVGHVQSGKTANYTGLICKALDSGYRIVVVLAGILNSLRKQTQARIDDGVIGLDSSLLLKNVKATEKVRGVGLINHEERKCPVSITSIISDFSRSSANQRQTAINQYAPPVIFVIKKNVSILQNLVEWLQSNNLDLSNHPMLLIDDEADHASINTNKPDLDPTKTNEYIRQLLSIFPKNVYIGYTATPFANIFINPDSVEEMLGDLFPENFIKTLDAPTNYFGSDRIFSTNDKYTIVEINDADLFMPRKHKISHRPKKLSESIKSAVREFVLVCAIRRYRKHSDCHNSMMVNVTRFTDIQSVIKIELHNYLEQLKASVKNYSKLDFEIALKNSEINSIYDSWVETYSSKSEWKEIVPLLNEAIAKIEVIEVNSSNSGNKEIDYSKRSYPSGRSVIVVGGLSLSRGITVEGLSVSYFLRDSIMYDTLMQMGRWFGYRDGYEDLCRIFMTSAARGWYEYIADATEELRKEFMKMEQMDKSPKEFGLCVRNHPSSLIVTARNKMRSSKKVIREIDLTGKLIETSRLYTKKDIVQRNINTLEELIGTLIEGDISFIKEGSSFVWKGVDHRYVTKFVESFLNHPESSVTDSRDLGMFISKMCAGNPDVKWNVALISPSRSDYTKTEEPIIIKLKHIGEVNPSVRRDVRDVLQGIMLNQRKLGSAGAEKIDLRADEERKNPLLMLHVLDCRKGTKGEITESVSKIGIAAYGVSFPGSESGVGTKIKATYQVNTIWMRDKYENELETDEDVGDDI